MSSAGTSAISPSAILASRAEAPTRKPPVISLSSASRSDGSQTSIQAATRAGIASFEVSCSAATTSESLGAIPGALPGQINDTVSARSPT
jgi:hypothetical protein